MDRYSWISTQFEPAAGLVKKIDGAYVRYTDHLAALAEKDKEIERLKVLVADLTLGCMDNVEIRTAKHHFTGMNLAIDEDLAKEDSNVDAKGEYGT